MRTRDQIVLHLAHQGYYFATGCRSAGLHYHFALRRPVDHLLHWLARLATAAQIVLVRFETLVHLGFVAALAARPVDCQIVVSLILAGYLDRVVVARFVGLALAAPVAVLAVGCFGLIAVPVRLVVAPAGSGVVLVVPAALVGYFGPVVALATLVAVPVGSEVVHFGSVAAGPAVDCFGLIAVLAGSVAAPVGFAG